MFSKLAYHIPSSTKLCLMTYCVHITLDLSYITLGPIILWALTTDQMPVLRLYKGTYELGRDFHNSVCYFGSLRSCLLQNKFLYFTFVQQWTCLKFFPVCYAFFFMWNCVRRIFITELWQYFILFMTCTLQECCKWMPFVQMSMLHKHTGPSDICVCNKRRLSANSSRLVIRSFKSHFHLWRSLMLH
jgi:hypothetical protein